MTATTARHYTREIPLGFNGYVTVAQPAQRMPASEIRAGDVLLLDGYVSAVQAVRTYHLAPNWPLLHIAGDVNVARFPHELVSVIRRTAGSD